MALNASAKATLASKKIALDAWNDDWEVLADNEPNSGVKLTPAQAAPAASTTSKRPTIMARNPSSTKPAPAAVDELASEVRNLQLWNQANSTSAFEVVSSASQPAKVNYKPELKILKRAPNVPNAGKTTPKASDGKDDPEETSAERIERLRKERESKYNETKERIFGSADNKSATVAAPTIEKTSNRSGKNSGTSTPRGDTRTGSGNDSGKATPNRKTSPTNKQRRRKEAPVDDDFVPRGAFVGGTYESYAIDQQRLAATPAQSYPAYPQYAGPATSMTLPTTDQYNYPQSAIPGIAGGQVGYATTRPAPAQSTWDGQGAFHQQYPTHPYSQQSSQQQYQQPYSNYQSPPSQQQYQAPPPQPQQQVLQQQLYDPLYPSSNLPPHLQYQHHNDNLQQRQTQQIQQPIRAPKGPDSSGIGFGFNRGGGAIGGSKGTSRQNYPQPDSRQQSYHPMETPSSGFNSAAAAAPWGGPNHSQSQIQQIWNGGGNGQNQGYPQQYNNGGGNGGIWGGGSGTWQRGDN